MVWAGECSVLLSEWMSFRPVIDESSWGRGDDVRASGTVVDGKVFLGGLACLSVTCLFDGCNGGVEAGEGWCVEWSKW